jgi:type IV conjugative transfer system protein TraL
MKYSTYGFLDEPRKIAGVTIAELIAIVVGLIIGLIATSFNFAISMIVSTAFWIAMKILIQKNSKGFVQKLLLNNFPQIFGSRYLRKILGKNIFL